MTRISLPPTTSRPMPTNINNVHQMHPCPSNIISSPLSIRYITQHNNNNNGSGSSSRLYGSTCCCKWNFCYCCRQWFHLKFLRKTPGIMKILEALIGVICQFLLLYYGAQHTQVLNESYTLFLISVSSCLTTTILLLGCYLVSRNTFHLVKSSIFEPVFNTTACILTLTSSSYLAYAVTSRLFDDYTRIPYFQAYPALSGAYILGFILSLLHGADAYCSYMYNNGVR